MRQSPHHFWCMRRDGREDTDNSEYEFLTDISIIEIKYWFVGDMSRPSKWCVVGLWMVSCAKPELILVLLSENKKSLGMPGLGFLGVTWTATTSHPWLDAALFCHPWQNITVCRQAYQDFLIFSQSHKISSGFAQDASLQIMNTIWFGGSSQNWGRGCEFLIFARMEMCLKS